MLGTWLSSWQNFCSHKTYKTRVFPFHVELNLKKKLVTREKVLIGCVPRITRDGKGRFFNRNFLFSRPGSVAEVHLWGYLLLPYLLPPPPAALPLPTSPPGGTRQILRGECVTTDARRHCSLCDRPPSTCNEPDWNLQKIAYHESLVKMRTRLWLLYIDEHLIRPYSKKNYFPFRQLWLSDLLT